MTRRRALGGKGAGLVALQGLAQLGGFAVPSFVVLDPDEVAGIIQGADDARLLAAPRELARGRAACPALAVRSSAVGEDGTERSFAGQFATVLGVDPEKPGALLAAVRAVAESAESAHARAYRGAGGVRMAVVLQELLAPAVSGVAFSIDPLAPGGGRALVSAVYGLGEGLVQGTLDADTYRVGADGAVERVVARKTLAVRASQDGTRLVAVDEERAAAAALSDAEACAIARCACFLAAELGRPQDIEWALDEGRRLHVLQTRPITALAAAERIVWDNSNIVESYAGVTTPLTFSFARHVYEIVYRQFVELLGVPDALVREHDATFANMLGLVRGRVYYNLISWYRVIALLPGLRFNRGFMEKMMGVREALAAPPPPATLGNRLGDALRIARTIVRMLVLERRLGRAVPAFHARVDAALAPLDGAALTAPEAIAHYRRLEDELLRNWRTPIVNDFFAMIAFGTLSRLAERWLPGAPKTIVNDLLCGEGGIVSTEPARALMEAARMVEGDARALFDAEPDDLALWERLTGPLKARLAAFRARYGDRGMEELKLETVTPAEDPGLIVGMVRAYVASGRIDPEATRKGEQAIRQAAEALVRQSLDPVRRALFFAVLGKARARVRDRENLRFERTRVFGVVRRLVLVLGEDLARRGRLAAPRDVFHLEIDEVLGGGHEELKALVAARQARFAAFASTPAPPDRFETYGAPDDDAIAPRAVTVRTGDLAGIGCCPGVVRARVRIVRDPREAGDLAGRILVAERTDPGWTLLFPIASGLLVQRGSLLSHAAIVAREVGLPCVVGIADLLDTVADGELVEMDGATGVVRRLETRA